MASSAGREPWSEAHGIERARPEVTTSAEARQLAAVSAEIAKVDRALKAVPPLREIWAGKYAQPEEKTFVHKGGDPLKPGDGVVPASPTMVDRTVPSFAMEADAPEGERRRALGEWIVRGHPSLLGAASGLVAGLVAITPAMREGSGMLAFSQRFPSRYHDVGIAEQHAVTFAAGLACEGLKPVVAIYSTFLQRAYDQLIHDVALQKMPMVLALDRAGIVGADGPTHAGVYDIPFLRCIPQVSIACPADENECRMLLSTAHAQDHTVAVRYPRGAGAGTAGVVV